MAIAPDETKRASTIAKHGVDFASAVAFDWVAALVRADTRKEYGEPRLVAMAPIGMRLHVMVFTVERRAVRVISLRKANSREFDRYAREA